MNKINFYDRTVNMVNCKDQSIKKLFHSRMNIAVNSKNINLCTMSYEQ